VVDLCLVFDQIQIILNPRNKLPEATDGMEVSPAGESRDRLAVARFTHTQELQGGPQWINPSACVRNTSWINFRNPLLSGQRWASPPKHSQFSLCSNIECFFPARKFHLVWGCWNSEKLIPIIFPLHSKCVHIPIYTNYIPIYPDYIPMDIDC